jgi:antibiotic biosynthesis monooxygenase (ABM) superfamily enzyme
MIFELRQYRMNPGKEAEWIALMDEVIIPGQTAAGAVILGTFVGTEEKDLYVWIRRFDNEEQKAAFYKAYYESEEWVNDLKPRVGELLDRSRMVITLLDALPGSGIQ